MQPLLPLRPQLTRQIDLLNTSPTRLSLMSVAIPNLPRQAIAAAILAATTAADLVGMLDDGSVGIFALRAPDGGGDVDERFLARLQAALRNSVSPSFAGNKRLWFRSVHRWASEIGDPEDLIAALSATSARVIGIGLPPAPGAVRVASHRSRPAPPDRPVRKCG